MSDQAAPLYIQPQGDKYAIVASSVAAPPFPDITLSLVFDIGDALKRLIRKLPPDQAQLLNSSLVSVFSDEHAKSGVQLPKQEGRTLWASFTAQETKMIAGRLEALDWKAVTELLRSTSINGLEAEDVLECLKETKLCFETGAKRNFGIAFFAYE